jgi:serine/threonine protein kinase
LNGERARRQAARIVRDLASAVAVVHGFGIIHREIVRQPIRSTAILLQTAEAALAHCLAN